MYRVKKNTTKKTEFTCLNCKHFDKKSDKTDKSCYGECTAPKKVLFGEFNAKDYYCIEYRGFGEISQSEINDIVQKQREKYAKKEYERYVKTYYSKEDAKRILKGE